MRSAAELKWIVESTIKTAGGTAPFTIAAQSEAEADAFKALLKGKHGAKVIDVQVKPPAYFAALQHTPWAQEASGEKKGKIWEGAE
jgi:hypothetical protein